MATRITVRIELDSGPTLVLTEEDLRDVEFSLPKEYGSDRELIGERFEFRANLNGRSAERWTNKE